jgi:hypothetical protein
MTCYDCYDLPCYDGVVTPGCGNKQTNDALILGTGEKICTSWQHVVWGTKLPYVLDAHE